MLCIGGIPRVGEWVSLGLRGNVTIWFLFRVVFGVYCMGLGWFLTLLSCGLW